MSPTAISVKNISKSFGSPRFTGEAGKVCAVKGLSFEVEADSCFGFLGPNGAGKTTLLKMLYGRCTKEINGDGEINVFGYDPAKDELAIKYLSGVVPQDNNLDEELNVIGNLMVYSRFYALPRAAAKSRIDYLLNFLELSDKRTAKIKELSGGMQRRLVIARALMNNPKLLILDEPTTGLDPQVRHLIWDKLRQLKRHGTTILLTTHYMEEAFALCDTILIMDKGRGVMSGSPAQLLEQNIEKFVLEITGSQSFDAIADSDAQQTVRVDRSEESLRLYSDDAQRLRQLAGQLQGAHYYLRQANLEDVFLKATGRALNERQ
ncbi:MAG: ABC transporter ATP-binding protein [Planctomycetota bacterium]